MARIRPPDRWQLIALGVWACEEPIAAYDPASINLPLYGELEFELTEAGVRMLNIHRSCQKTEMG